MSVAWAAGMDREEHDPAQLVNSPREDISANAGLVFLLQTGVGGGRLHRVNAQAAHFAQAPENAAAARYPALELPGMPGRDEVVDAGLALGQLVPQVVVEGAGCGRGAECQVGQADGFDFAAEVEPQAAHDRDIIVRAHHGVDKHRPRQGLGLEFKPHRTCVNRQEMTVAGIELKIVIDVIGSLNLRHHVIGIEALDIFKPCHRAQGHVVKIEFHLWPESEYVEDAKAKIRFANDQLAGKEMQIGRYYLERREYLAAIKRFRSVVETYSNTRHIEEALARLVEAYYAMGLTDEAQTAAAVLGQNYPDSQWYKDSYKLLQGGGLAPRENAGSWISKAGKLITG